VVHDGGTVQGSPRRLCVGHVGQCEVHAGRQLGWRSPGDGTGGQTAGDEFVEDGPSDRSEPDHGVDVAG
jgi:hypothetical protein